MTNAPRRAALDFGDDGQPSPLRIDAALVKQVAKSAGLRETPTATTSQPMPIASGGIVRRPRRRTGRTEQFATRLKRETLQAIYDYADQHDITLAETIEIAMAQLADQG
ncbi:hypothetical protein [Kozakia baliensis]|uniref:Uncharacterized protein n=1 Tax=Kozakia baliensis TaxID=153496 RepID=A0A1D8UY14_9PROT|nr:hypothetical protein [Kozakia baliensis]AOX18491.1 hypothetical protein A0U89_14410 [Kozakia baliensis]GBR33231.1 hypothetical protein AA0488_2685 [Kozakia baliensis NRIC 0488]GEL65712.1 hypothetical protein KBA01_29980 [Kozakia baliensis]